MDTPETLIARLEALIAKWQEAIALSEREVAAGEYSQAGEDSQRGRRVTASEFIADLQALRRDVLAAHALSGATPAEQAARLTERIEGFMQRNEGVKLSPNALAMIEESIEDALTPVSPTAPEPTTLYAELRKRGLPTGEPLREASVSPPSEGEK